MPCQSNISIPQMAVKKKGECSSGAYEQEVGVHSSSPRGSAPFRSQGLTAVELAVVRADPLLLLPQRPLAPRPTRLPAAAGRPAQMGGRNGPLAIPRVSLLQMGYHGQSGAVKHNLMYHAFSAKAYVIPSVGI
jgi:hypothetical protein